MAGPITVDLMAEELPPPVAPPPSTPPPPPSDKPTNDQWVGIVGGVGAVIGSFLPWAQVTTGFGTISRAGTDGGGDGVITLILGALGAFLLWRGGKATPWAGACGVAVAAIAIWDYYDIEGSAIEVGVGLYITGAGGALLGIMALDMWGKQRKAAKAAPRT
jgi:hypothetical protein